MRRDFLNSTDEGSRNHLDGLSPRKRKSAESAIIGKNESVALLLAIIE